MKNEAKRSESVRKGVIPCLSIRGHGIRKREVPFLKHDTWLECESMVKEIGCDKKKNETF